MKKTLLGIQIAIVRGHPMGEGARGETAWNEILCDHMVSQLTERGADVYVHNHTVSSYGRRQDIMRDAVNRELPDCKVVLEAHYNSYSKPSACGHEFLFANTSALAKAIQKRFSAKYPWSKARGGGVQQVLSGNGAGFLIKAPAASVITEPFFESNQNEMAEFRTAQAEVAAIYVRGIEDYLGVVIDEAPDYVVPVDPAPVPATLADRIERIENHLNLPKI